MLLGVVIGQRLKMASKWSYTKYKKTYNAWVNMRTRCRNPRILYAAYYTGRGITICKRWDLFENFLADMGKAPNNKQLDRIDNDKGYYPKNCKWSTRTEQANNTRRNVTITFNGKTKTLAQWSKSLKVNRQTVKERLEKGLSIRRAFYLPPKSGSELLNR